MKRSDIVVGQIYENPQGEKFEVVREMDNASFLVKFIATNNFQIVYASAFNLTKIKDYSQRPIFGIGYAIGSEQNPVILSNGLGDHSHKLWYGMMLRCYKDGGVKSYKDASVCGEWHNYMNFRTWYFQNCDIEHAGYFALDKDLFGNGKKMYSPETCCFLPNEINSTIKGLKRYDENNITDTSAKVVYHLSLQLEKYNDFLSDKVKTRLSEIVRIYRRKYQSMTGHDLCKVFENERIAKSDLSKVKLTAFVKYQGHLYEFDNVQQLREFVKEVETQIIFNEHKSR